jgi:hypothetical protein
MVGFFFLAHIIHQAGTHESTFNIAQRSAPFQSCSRERQGAECNIRNEKD